EQGNRKFTLPYLRSTMGETFRRLGQNDAAIHAYKMSVKDYTDLGMETMAAYTRLVLAETLIAADRPREAEWEILQALPTIDEQRMVPEGFAAMALLRESIKRKMADPNALRELREHLQNQN